MKKILHKTKSRLQKTSIHNRLTFVIVFAVIGLAMIAVSSAASQVNVGVDFGRLNSQPNFYPYQEAQIRIQQTGGPADSNLLRAIGVKAERSFIRLDKWKPTINSPLKTEHGRYGLGDSWLEEMNQRNVEPWITQEVDDWKSNKPSAQNPEPYGWFIDPNNLTQNGALNNAEFKKYEDVWYEIIKYTKQKSPQTRIVESLNESNCRCASGSHKLSIAEQVEFYVRNAIVVNRVNADLGLPKPGNPKLISGGPSFISVGLGNSDWEDWIDGVYARPNFESIKPAFLSFHDFNSVSKPSNLGTLGNKARSVMNKAKYNNAWNNTPLWNTAYNITQNEDNPSEPVANDSARWAAGFAAMHYYMMESGIEYSSMFAQSNYVGHNASLLLPKGQSHQISYYAPGKKTALYNYYDMMSRINGQRVETTGGTLAANGTGFGTDAVKGQDKGWLLSWNYNYPGSATDTNITYSLKNTRDIGIDDNESATAKIYRIDNQTSNIASGNHTKDGLELVDTIRIPAGANKTLNYNTSGYAILMVELTGNNDNGGGTTLDRTLPNVSFTSPAEFETINSRKLLVADASDNVRISKVEFLVNNSLVGTDSNTSDNTYTFNFDTTTYPNGNYTFTAKAYDTVGNVKTSSPVTLNISNIQVTVCNPDAVTQPTDNLLPNYSFEVINSSLNAVGSADFSWKDTGARSGNCMVQITSSDPNGSEISQRYVGPITDIPVTAGSEYELTGWIKTINAPAGASIRFNFWSGPNGSDFISGTTIISSSQTGTTGWTNVNAGRVVAPEGAQFGRIELRLAGSGTAQFDDVVVRKLEVTVPPTDTQPPTVNIQGGGSILASNDVNVIRINATDNGSVSRVALRIVGGQTIATDTSPPYDIEIDPTKLVNGDYNIEAVAYDSANNATVSASKIVKLRLPDINRDGRVEIGDLSLVIASWNQSTASNGAVTGYDLDGDGTVGIGDLTILISRWST